MTNLRARIRTLLLLLASNASVANAPAMVVSAVNETEMALGMDALYGDTAGGINLLGDLSRTDVRALATYVNERTDREVIPPEAFETRPRERFLSGRRRPLDYAALSPIIDDLLEHRISPSEIIDRFGAGTLDVDRYAEDERGRTIYERYDVESFAALVYDAYRRMAASTFKRVQSPPVVAVSERAFGTDFREPIINGWDGTLPAWAVPA